ncbi:hypothetical protein OF829_02380 [Sphingomonas sp. LB-2]|uniref:hypothetical protein n=1 Tax=Sphingomonas caeni TaxID=2984949 RepID=UPI0022301F68|nr:hypothetical protein [Sphingomonas caeni]MCW3846067.1 hypothetical protein [Sphingomonas caeni]
MKHWIRAAALLLPLALLSACLFQPGKFESTLTVHKDRSFTFTYKGEVVALDLEGMNGLPGMSAGDAAATDGSTPDNTAAAEEEQTPEQKAAAKAAKDEEYRELAANLAKEYGYRTVEYRGDGVFYVDYAISGVLTHEFVYPYNQDAAMIFPWVTVELRGGDTLKIKAPGYAKQDMSGMGAAGGGSGGDMPSKTQGSFTLITDAEIVSQNNENGAAKQGANSVVVWRVTPRTTDAPMAVLRVAAR